MEQRQEATYEWDMADRLRKAREVAGMDQGGMAARLSISRQSVVNYERRHTRPLPAIRKAWALACGVTDDYLTKGTPPTAGTSSDAGSDVTREYDARRLAQWPMLLRAELGLQRSA
jgi:transcriptional regulator with XRE-family HTH domain